MSFHRPGSAAPRVHLLSNGRYAVVLSDAGSGFSRWNDLAVTRWREDPTGDGWGSYVLLRDEDSGAVWSAGAQPYAQAAAAADFDADGRARFRRRDGGLETALEVLVGQADAECRRVVLSNRGDTAREISLTSYAELVLGPAGADLAHPAFSKMFVQTEWHDGDGGVLLAHRRKRAPGEPGVWAAHFVQAAEVEALPEGEPGYESDRACFLGRGHGLRDALAMRPGTKLSGTTGTVLDPVFSLRRRVRVPIGGRVELYFWTAVAETREAVLALVRGLRGTGLDGLRAEAAELARRRREQEGLDAVQAQRIDALLGPLLYADARWRAPAEQLAKGRGGPPQLWGRAISGDRPIVLLRIADAAGLPRAQELLQAQRYWRSGRLAADVVLLDVSGSGALAESMQPMVEAQQTALKAGEGQVRAEVFVLHEDQLDQATREGLVTAARIVLDAAGPWPDGTLAPVGAAPPSLPAARSPQACLAWSSADLPALEFANGHGGFAPDSGEYLIELHGEDCTPAPWVNVVANPDFGFLVSAEGSGYAWSQNSQQNPLTPWPNDPVSDAPHEVLYLRDEDSGVCWSATAAPVRVPDARYRVRHGAGYSCFDTEAHGIAIELLQFVPARDPLKLSRLRLCNRSAQRRRLSLTAYVEWALGANGTVPAPYVVSALAGGSGALLARNPWRAEFNQRVAFLDLGGVQQSASADRASFLGRHGTLAAPAAMRDGGPLDGRIGAGLDPCAALRTELELAPGEAIELRVLLGDAASADEAAALIARYREADLDAVFDEARGQWGSVLGAVQVHTPDRAMDLMLNHWLLYQTLACRLWARTAYYQASGAYGFRDQLQDSMALCLARPDLAREHLLRAAGRQFAEGDVQHWWLPPAGQGIRTRISDDRVWLAYVAAHYVEATGDRAVLDVTVPFLQGETLHEGQLDAFFQPAEAPQPGSLYEHAARALDTSLALGAHGLPLFGTGDWNDGMNAVGEQGRGESVWLAWLLLATIDAFAPLATARGDNARTARWRGWSERMRETLEQAGWDGGWYRRGYYDDGTPLGSADSDECRIDVIAQSWSVLARGADPARQRQAMEATERELVMHAERVSRLFTPPFERTPHNPGYIKGYPPGLRENGGQYTHGATWSIFAWAALGEGDRAGTLFDLLNPVRHAGSAPAAARYKVEPYVVSADVYSVAPLVGRGGWTWYTGSAGWLYRAGIEALLGLRLHGAELHLDPCIPAAWPGFRLSYRREADGAGVSVTRYEIAVENPERICRGVLRVDLDDVTLEPVDGAARIALRDDGGMHVLRVVLGRAAH